MTDKLKILEEISIRESFEDPHLSYIFGTVQERKRVAYLILAKKENEILLINRSGFLIDSVFAGLSGKNIEYIAKNGPRKYKENLWKILQDQEMMDGVFEISKDMDRDLNTKNASQNQIRIANVIQYIKDNSPVFKFI